MFLKIPDVPLIPTEGECGQFDVMRVSADEGGMGQGFMQTTGQARRPRIGKRRLGPRCEWRKVQVKELGFIPSTMES